MKLSELIEDLTQLNLNCGEIVEGIQAAQFIQEFEFEHGVEFSSEQIIKALRAAGESFVESMQQNEIDTEECVRDGLYNGYPIDSLETRLAGWEAMRPSVIRRNALVSILSV
jgi:hypothetical protein